MQGIIIRRIAKKSKKLHFAKHLSDCEHEIKKTWDTVKQVIGKPNLLATALPKE